METSIYSYCRRPPPPSPCCDPVFPWQPWRASLLTPRQALRLPWALAPMARQRPQSARPRDPKEVWNVAAVIPVEKGTVAGGGGGHHQHGGHKHDGQTKQQQQQQRELESSNSSSCFSDELVLDEENNFLGTELLKHTCKGKPRSVLEGDEQRRFFGLRTTEQRVIEFECGSQREYKMWTKGIARLLAIVDGRKC